MFSKDFHIRLVLALWGVFLVLLHLVASLTKTTLLWGVDSWFYFPPAWNYLLTLACLLAVIPQIGERAGAVISASLKNVFSVFRGKRVYAGGMLVALLAGIVFWSLRCRTHLLGDGQWWIRNLQRDISTWPNEPLSLYLTWMAYKYSPVLGLKLSAEQAFQAVSVTAGMLYVFTAVLLADRLGKSFVESMLVFFGLILLGSLELFFGYVETYPLLSAAVLFYIFLGQRTQVASVNVFAPALVFWLCVLLHRSAVVLTPSLLYLYFLWHKKTRRHAGNWKYIAAVLGPPVAATALVIITGLDLRVLFRGGGDTSHLFLPLVDVTSRYFSYSFMSATHFMALANLILIVSPFIVPLCLPVPGRLRKLSPFQRFLLILSIFPLAAVLCFNPELGWPRDWDVFVFAFIAPTLLGLTVFIDLAGRSEKLKHYALVLLLVVGGAHVIPWIAVNSDTARSLLRYDNITSDNLMRSVHARAFAHEEAGVYFRDNGNFEEAERHFEKAVEVDPGSYRLQGSLGGVYWVLGKREQGIAALRKSMELAPNSVHVIFALALYLHETGAFQESIQYFQKAAELDPSNSSIYWNLGAIYSKLGDLNQALAQFRHVVELAPDNQEAREYILKLEKMIEGQKSGDGR